MAVDINCTVTGLEGVEASLKKLGGKLASQYALKACEAGADVLAAEVAARTPVKSGLLASSITKVKVLADKLGTVGVAVGFGKQGYISRFIEFGHRTRLKQGIKHHSPNPIAFIPANPFMRNAFETSKNAAVEAFTASIRTSVESNK